MSTSSEYPAREQIAKDIRALKHPCPGHNDPPNVIRDCALCAENAAYEAAAQVAEKVRHQDSWVTPDWVMVGVPRSSRDPELYAGSGVMVLASTQLNGAEFIRELVGMEPVKVPGVRRLAQLPQYRNTLLAEVAHYQTVYAADYPSALRDLLSRAGWEKPDERTENLQIKSSLAIAPPE